MSSQIKRLPWICRLHNCSEHIRHIFHLILRLYFMLERALRYIGLSNTCITFNFCVKTIVASIPLLLLIPVSHHSLTTSHDYTLILLNKTLKFLRDIVVDMEFLNWVLLICHAFTFLFTFHFILGHLFHGGWTLRTWVIRLSGGYCCGAFLIKLWYKHCWWIIFLCTSRYLNRSSSILNI